MRGSVMIEIIDGFTSIWTGSDPISPLGDHHRTGARVTLEFCREAALSPGEIVCARYDFGGDGRMRATTGVAQHTHSVARSGRAPVFHYRISHWIAPAALTETVCAPLDAERAGDRFPA
jgi:hypothetical protein